uniref:Uncharacterized protein n=1 Tax=Nothobranchius furzeri TaxID=105023 RepID=A0A8C6NHG0_NOTFU
MHQLTCPPPPTEMSCSPVAENWSYTLMKVLKCYDMWTISNVSFCHEETGEVIKVPPSSQVAMDVQCVTSPNGESKQNLPLHLLLLCCSKVKFIHQALTRPRGADLFVHGKDWSFKKFLRRDFWSAS